MLLVMIIKHSCDCAGVVGGVVVALLLALCICFMLRRKRNKQVGERRVAAKRQKEQAKQQKVKKASGSWLGFLKRRKGGPGAGQLHPSLAIQAIIQTHSLSTIIHQLLVQDESKGICDFIDMSASTRIIHDVVIMIQLCLHVCVIAGDCRASALCGSCTLMGMKACLLLQTR